jgi:hypothetical protein
MYTPRPTRAARDFDRFHTIVENSQTTRASHRIERFPLSGTPTRVILLTLEANRNLSRFPKRDVTVSILPAHVAKRFLASNSIESTITPQTPPRINDERR